MSKVSIVYTRATLGLNSPLVTVEVDLTQGLPALNIVGMPETAVRESKDRVRSALINSGYHFPMSRITVNLAPADLPKQSGRYDLPIALGILAASGQLPIDSLKQFEFLGELALTGDLRPITGALSAALASTVNERQIIMPKASAAIASLCKKSQIFGANNLLDVCSHITKQQMLQQEQGDFKQSIDCCYDLSDIKGQHQAKRALAVAAAGGHHLLFYGSPGTGKTMLAKRLPTILPPLTDEEALEVSSIHSIDSQYNILDWKKRPFRNPHHTSSSVSLVGGGTRPKPGEISYAHHGVLFLDELPEFQRSALEVLREPLETGEVIITRSQGRAIFPAVFQMVAAMNPCPCGYLGDLKRQCQCSHEQVRRYQQKVSGPLLNRIDLQVEVSSQDANILFSSSKTESSSEIIRNKVIAARQIQYDRQGKINANLTSKEVNQYCTLSHQNQLFLTNLADKFGYSARAIHRTLKVARTLADLDGCLSIEKKQLAEAIHYRKLDRN